MPVRRGSSCLHAIDRLNDVRARLPLNVEEHGRLLAVLCADPGGELIVLHAIDDVGDVAEPNRRAIFVSDDDRLIGVRGKNLIVRPDGERLARSVEASFRAR